MERRRLDLDIIGQKDIELLLLRALKFIIYLALNTRAFGFYFLINVHVFY